jgi:hypothetical protein
MAAGDTTARLTPSSVSKYTEQAFVRAIPPRIFPSREFSPEKVKKGVLPETEGMLTFQTALLTTIAQSLAHLERGLDFVLLHYIQNRDMTLTTTVNTILPPVIVAGVIVIGAWHAWKHLRGKLKKWWELGFAVMAAVFAGAEALEHAGKFLGVLNEYTAAWLAAVDKWLLDAHRYNITPGSGNVDHALLTGLTIQICAPYLEAVALLAIFTLVVILPLVRIAAPKKPPELAIDVLLRER